MTFFAWFGAALAEVARFLFYGLAEAWGEIRGNMDKRASEGGRGDRPNARPGRWS